MPSTLRWRCRPIHSSCARTRRSRRRRAARPCAPPASSGCPVELLLLVPGDEGVAQQRGQVVGDRAAGGVLEVEDAGVRLRHHQVARHPVAVHRDARLRERRRDELVARLRPRPRAPPASRRPPHSRATHQSGKSASSRRSSASSYAGSAVPGTFSCQVTRRAYRIAHQRVGADAVAARLRREERLQVELAAEIVEEEKAVPDIVVEDARRMQAGRLDRGRRRGRRAARLLAAAAHP